MRLKKQAAYMGLCLGVLAFAIGAQPAISATATEDITVTVVNPDPDIQLSGLTWTTGTFLAVNSKTTVATATVDPTGAVTTSQGSLGNARLIGSDTTGSALSVVVGSITAGAPNASMNLKIADNTTNLVKVNLVSTLDPVNNAPFSVDTWVAGTPVKGTVTSFVGTTGLGVIVLDTNGEFEVNFGATLSTVKDALPKPYADDDYTGTVKVTLNY